MDSETLINHVPLTDPIPLILGFLFLLLLLSFFAGTEFPLLSVGEHKIQAFLRQKRYGAKSLAKLRKRGEALLVTNLIGTTLATIGASSVATFLAIRVAEGNTTFSHEHVITLMEIGSSLLILFLGEIGPKIVGITIPETIALMVAPVYTSIFFIFRPISWAVEKFTAGISRLTGRSLEIHPKTISDEEFDAFIDMSHRGGAVEADERRQIKNLLSLGEMTADSVMTPRVNVKFVYLDNTVDEVCDFLMSSSHTRVPVAGETTDDVDFVITFREAFKMQKEGHGSAKLKSLDLEKIMKVPLTQALDDLFEKFQKSRRHIALVLDEHGGTAGVVSMEDVLEEVFGDIKDEKDKEEIYLRKHKGGIIDAVGTVLIDDIMEEYDINADDYGIPTAYTGVTLSYVIIAEEEEFPTAGTEVIFHGSHGRIVLRVIDVHDNVIERVECEKHHH